MVFFFHIRKSTRDNSKIRKDISQRERERVRHFAQKKKVDEATKGDKVDIKFLVKV